MPGPKVVFYQVQSNAAEIEAMRSGRLHVAGFSTGPTAFAVNLAGAVPFAAKGTAKEESDFRIIYRSQKFPTSSFAYAHDLDPKLVDKMLGCFYNYRFPPEMQNAFDGADRFFPINYKTSWEVVRNVAKGSGGGFDKATYEKETAREAAEAAKKK
jgi:ABC-type phosphate/phosphonate transport system substrate-binding protein